MVVCNDPVLADRVSLLRNHGQRPKYYNEAVGGNFRMDALQAAILRAKFKYLEGWTEARRRNAALYRQFFVEAGLASEDVLKRSEMPVVFPKETGWGRHIYHLYQTRVRKRDALMDHLKAHGVGTEVYYPVPLHLQACFKDLGYKASDFPNAERAALETLALPVYPELTEEQIRYVVSTVADFYQVQK